MSFNVICLDLPTKTKGFTKYNSEEDFYIIFLNAKLNFEQQQSTFIHEMEHISNTDFNQEDIQKIEFERH